MPPGTNPSDVLDVPRETARAWESIGRLELRRAASEGGGVRRRLGQYVAFARMAAGAAMVGTAEYDPLRGIAGGQLSLRDPVADAICEAVELGMSLSGAASCAGVTPRTATSWRQRGRAVQERLESGQVQWDDLDPREHAVYVFAVNVARAEGQAEGVAVRSILDAARGALAEDGSLAMDASGRPIRPGDWRAAMAFLERRYPESWRRPKRDYEPGEAAPERTQRARPTQIVIHVPASAVPAQTGDDGSGDAASGARGQHQRSVDEAT